MYTHDLCANSITRDSDGMVVWPSQDYNSEHSVALKEWLAAGNVATRVADPAAYKSIAVDAVQMRLDAHAQALGYDSILSAVSYRDSAVVSFRDEGLAFSAWRDACWEHCYSGLADVQAGLRELPTIDELLAGLPAL